MQGCAKSLQQHSPCKTSRTCSNLRQPSWCQVEERHQQFLPESQNLREAHRFQRSVEISHRRTYFTDCKQWPPCMTVKREQFNTVNPSGTRQNDSHFQYSRRIQRWKSHQAGPPQRSTCTSEVAHATFLWRYPSSATRGSQQDSLVASLTLQLNASSVRVHWSTFGPKSLLT